MSVEFEEPPYPFDKNAQSAPAKGTPIMNLVIKAKLAKTPAQANIVMIIICIIFLVASFIIVKLAT